MTLRQPGSTYRLQLNREFPVARVRELVPYLAELGITDLYVSPVFVARPGSLHGYDVLDHGRFNPELGSEEEFRALAAELRGRGMGLLMDIVPNHMCIASPTNAWWMDVLENGPSSPFARWFDIDWEPPKPDLVNKVLLPVLGDQYGRVLENQELQVALDGGAFWLDTPAGPLPLAPKSWALVLEPALTRLEGSLAPEDPRQLELESILTALRHLPGQTETSPELVRERQREKEITKHRLAAALADPAVATAVADSVAELNGHRGDPRSFDRLEALLDQQAYRLSFWRVAADEINYRRFFDVNELAAIRVEEPEVFQAVHALAFRLVGDGLVTGLRIDHIDGLLEPERYLRDLQAELARLSGGGPFYVVVEKILEGDERLRPWPVAGTTGYDALNLLGGVFVHPDGEAPIRALYHELTGTASPWADEVYAAKHLVLEVSLSSELTVLARRLDRISEQHRFSRDFTLNSLQDALREVIACFPVYRTYVARETRVPEEADRRHVQRAVAAAKRRNPATSASLYDFVESLLLLEPPPGLDPDQLADRMDFVLRFQQLAGPVMAKGLEDTACYRWFPLAALAEVGGDPDRFALPLGEFHARNERRLERAPHSLVATSTHDTKRGEAVRARIRVLSEVPEEWAAAARRWRQLNAGHRRIGADSAAPSGNEEYLLYQTLVGTWPPGVGARAVPAAYVARIQTYMLKAIREAKRHTSWISPNEAHERAVAAFIDEILTPAPDNAFLSDLVQFQARLLRPGLWASLSETLLKMTVPGVPDFYQGTETWEFRLVDPDNRVPVDFEYRRALRATLQEAEREDPEGLRAALADRPEDDRLKLLLIARGLGFRARAPEVFRHGRYLPLEARGARADQVVAFARSGPGGGAIVAAGRFFARMPADTAPVGAAVWGDTTLHLPVGHARGRARDTLTGREVALSGKGVPLAELFAELPFALLEWFP